MKKFLLFALMLSTAFVSAWAVTDGVAYERVNGIGIKNVWIQDRVHTPDVWSNQPYCNTSARTAVMKDGFIYIARSNANTVIQGTDTLSQSVIYKIDAATGQLIKELPLTLDGNIYGGAVLSSNTVGIDNFGNLYMSPYSSELASQHSVYLVDKETGELTLMGELDKGDALQRCDYIDVMGDITREQAECNIMTVGASSEYIYRWHAEQGEDWEGGFDGDPYLAILDFYPETVTQWGYAPVAKMVLNGEDDFSGSLFYIDGFQSSPILYDETGTMVDNFENVDPAFWPMDVGANGVCEFTLDGRNFIVYVAAQYTGYDETTNINKACQVYICELGEGMSLGGMQRYWMVPDALGTVSDGGTRVQSMNVEYGTDAEGNEEITLFIFKCYNGMAVYKIGPGVTDDDPDPGKPGDVNGDGEVNIADVNALIDMILSGVTTAKGDVNGDSEVNIADVNALIDMILSH
ncbi:MAG: dockerin type I repeat-containing protein [Muribaculaceae bacterium]|nr:dockerin type I repeat-containing protein [Muribaculaceae bacterium]